ncbi:MAG: PEP-CTERM sorting domain-containing protein [Sedimentisphaerales bacterium]
MRTILIALMIIAAVAVPAGAIEILLPGYTVETYATYSDSVGTTPFHMTFDGRGNLYSLNSSGIIWRITPSKVASQFASGFAGYTSLTWGGGSAFGDNLYVGGPQIIKLAMDGTPTFFANHDSVSSLAIDKKGNYGGFLYAGTGSYDDFHKIDTSGNIYSFSNWPGSTNGGEPDGLAFDPGTAFDGALYVGTNYLQNNASKSGLFKMDTSGVPTRFSSNLVQAWDIAFDNTGHLGGKLFVGGRTDYQMTGGIYMVDVDGTATRFANMSPLLGLGMAFGPDGALYLTEYSSSNSMYTILRVTPEPATLLLLGLGSVMVRRKTQFLSV